MCANGRGVSKVEFLSLLFGLWGIENPATYSRAGRTRGTTADKLFAVMKLVEG